jgi:hypothetical protein
MAGCSLQGTLVVRRDALRLRVSERSSFWWVEAPLASTNMGALTCANAIACTW